MSRARTLFRCDACGGTSAKWVGRCPTCSAWNTLVEEVVPTAPAVPGAPRRVGPGRERGDAPDRPMPIAEVDALEWLPRPTGIAELDRVLGGGLVPGSVTLLGGEPGIGKSTLLLQMLASWAVGGATALYVSAEESKAQVRLRAERLGCPAPSVWLASDVALPHLLAHTDHLAPEILVVDSIQTVYDPDVGSAPGSVSQVRECTARLVHEAKSRDLTTVLVGHVTKEGSLAGPRVLEHAVDTVLAFEGDQHHSLRLLRATKHRFGSTDELGLFEMTESGLVAVPDPSRLFLADRRKGIAGSVVVPTIEGHRPLLVEVQALVAQSVLPTPRRSAQGVDSGRLALSIAVLAQRVQLPISTHDVYALAVGGVKVVEPAADLALGLALASSLTGRPLPDDVVACGEVGLGGELRRVRQFERRIAEAARLGFRRAVVPRLAPDPPPGIELLRAATLGEAIALMGLGAP